MDERIWWRDGDPDWWEAERRDAPLFRALAARDPFADPSPASREALARVGALLQAVVLESAGVLLPSPSIAEDPPSRGGHG
ncbi:MAG: hypothetical protein ABIK65_11340 [Candidatus Eisenbacteria bacterium]